VFRTTDHTHTIDNFSGVNDMVDSVRLPKGAVPYSLGGYYSEQGDFRRLGGKVLTENSTALGSVLSIKQLTFGDTNFVVVHTSTLYRRYTSLATLVSSNSSTDIMGPII